MANALLGYGIQVRMSTVAAPTAWTTIAECFKASPPSDSDDQIDVTHYQSPGKRREFIGGLIDGGEVQFEMNYIPGSATDVFLVASQGQVRNVEVTFQNGVVYTFQALRKGYEITAPVDDRMTSTATFKVTGAVAQSAGAAPTNPIAPAISGQAKNTFTLTALEGDWTGAPIFTYVWKKNAVANGTTTRTYVCVAGDIGATMTCTITGTNGAGNLVVTSAPTAVVVA
jgi:Lambda phage tail tube protein, TTP